MLFLFPNRIGLLALPAITFRLWLWERILELSVAERVDPLSMFLSLPNLHKYRWMYFLLSLFSEERNDWITTLLNALKLQSPWQSQAVAVPEKCGYLELRGYKAKIFTALSGNSVWLCKNEQVSCVTVMQIVVPSLHEQLCFVRLTSVFNSSLAFALSSLRNVTEERVLWLNFLSSFNSKKVNLQQI